MQLYSHFSDSVLEPWQPPPPPPPHFIWHVITHPNPRIGVGQWCNGRWTTGLFMAVEVARLASHHNCNCIYSVGKSEPWYFQLHLTCYHTPLLWVGGKGIGYKLHVNKWGLFRAVELGETEIEWTTFSCCLRSRCITWAYKVFKHIKRNSFFCHEWYWLTVDWLIFIR